MAERGFKSKEWLVLVCFTDGSTYSFRSEVYSTDPKVIASVLGSQIIDGREIRSILIEKVDNTNSERSL